LILIRGFLLYAAIFRDMHFKLPIANVPEIFTPGNMKEENPIIISAFSVFKGG
jgi:hypothetical protein